jgi:hypothetical protein
MGRTRVARHPEEGFVDFEQRLIDRLVSRAAQDQLVRFIAHEVYRASGSLRRS